MHKSYVLCSAMPLSPQIWGTREKKEKNMRNRGYAWECRVLRVNSSLVLLGRGSCGVQECEDAGTGGRDAGGGEVSQEEAGPKIYPSPRLKSVGSI